MLPVPEVCKIFEIPGGVKGYKYHLMENSIVLGADIGGSHITAALVDLKSRSLLPETRVRKHVDPHAGADEIFGVWNAAISEATAGEVAFSGKMGFAMPGPFDYQQGVSLMKGQEKFDALFGMNIRNILAEKQGVEPGNIRFMNDAGCFLQGEVYGGAARGYNRAIGMTLGTGVGTARCADGVARDADLWHTPFKESVVEDYFSTRWFVKRYRELSGKEITGAKELVALYGQDPLAERLFEEFGNNLSDFSAFFIEKDEPEVVVLGGNIANAIALFAPALENGLAKRAIRIPVKKALLAEDAALIGAASCWDSAGASAGKSELFKPKA